MFARKLLPALEKKLELESITSPIGVQKPCFSRIKSGGDLICKSAESSGKSTVLCIGLIQKLQKAVDDIPRAIVFVPDAEHSAKLFEMLTELASKTDLRIFDAHEPTNYDMLKDAIYMGSDIVIGTAIRLAELYNSNVINLSDLKLFAIDDFDALSRNDANAQLERLTDSAEKAQKLIFCSNLNGRIERYAERFLKFPELIVQ